MAVLATPMQQPDTAAALRVRAALPAVSGTPLGPVEVRPLLDSTQAELMRRGAAQADRSVLIADAQSAGRGRLGRAWLSPPGANLYLSMYLRSPRGGRFAPGLALALGVAACEALRQAGFAQVGLKWPNDLIADGGKLGGILVESAGALDGAVAGIGINLHLAPEQAAAIGQPAAALSQFGDPPGRDVVAAAVIAAWNLAADEFAQYGFAPFQPRWRVLDAFAGKPVRAVCGGEVADGLAQGVDGQGRLLLQVDGTLRAFVSAETSLRPGSAGMDEAGCAGTVRR